MTTCGTSGVGDVQGLDVAFWDVACTLGPRHAACARLEGEVPARLGQEIGAIKLGRR